MTNHQHLRIVLLLILACSASPALARDIHVSPKGATGADGSAEKPFATISAAAELSQPGDVITVHAGTYRERITPPRGGTSNENRIVYQAAVGEEVVVKGSEVVRGWEPEGEGVWKVTLPNSFFGDYNPYQDLIHGDWFNDKKRPHHTGEVYIGGKSLWETHELARVRNPQPAADVADPEGSTWTWYCESDAQSTTIYANFHDKDPNEELVEINVRDSCFYPARPGCDYITIRGFRMCHAATQWAAPTAEQIGLIGTHWSKGWIIENNVISDSKCSGITLGKDRATGHNVWTNDPSKDGATHYNEVIVRALEAGWSREKIGSHLVRGNVIFNCEQTGICGSLGPIFSVITNNHIYNIWAKRQFTGAEMAGIKLHGAIDVLIAHNHIHHAGRGMWMDWMAQGTRITGNLCYENTTDDLFVEVNHGPFLVDNNIFLSPVALRDWSEGGAYVHNLFAGQLQLRQELKRSTPYHVAHTTKLAGLGNIPGGDNRFYNNIFIGPAGEAKNYGLAGYDAYEFPLQAAGNVYYGAARPYAKETDPLVFADRSPQPEIVTDGDAISLRLTLGPGLEKAATQLVTTELLAKARVPNLPYENFDGDPVRITTDYFRNKRNQESPTPGPFENPGADGFKLRVW
ncbi:MAG: right-handed parallel beta-helix repeat-containing protein [Planctomycetota bacterium]